MSDRLQREKRGCQLIVNALVEEGCDEEMNYTLVTLDGEEHTCSVSDGDVQPLRLETGDRARVHRVSDDEVKIVIEDAPDGGQVHF